MIHESFHWTDQYGRTFVFDVSALNAAVYGPPDCVEISAELVKHVEEHNGTSFGHACQLPDDITNRPVLVIQQPDDRCILVDGNHRLLRRHAMGHRTILAHIIPPHLWQPYCHRKPGADRKWWQL